MATRVGDITQGFTEVDQAADPRFFVEFLDARRTIEGEREVKQLILEMLDLKPGRRCSTSAAAPAMTCGKLPG